MSVDRFPIIPMSLFDSLKEKGFLINTVSLRRVSPYVRMVFGFFKNNFIYDVDISTRNEFIVIDVRLANKDECFAVQMPLNENRMVSDDNVADFNGLLSMKMRLQKERVDD